jgi:hypothetical protein
MDTNSNSIASLPVVLLLAQDAATTASDIAPK